MHCKEMRVFLQIVVPRTVFDGLKAKSASQVFFLKILSPSSPILGHNWKHDIARSCFILESIYIVYFCQFLPILQIVVLEIFCSQFCLQVFRIVVPTIFFCKMSFFKCVWKLFFCKCFCKLLSKWNQLFKTAHTPVRCFVAKSRNFRFTFYRPFMQWRIKNDKYQVWKECTVSILSKIWPLFKSKNPCMTVATLCHIQNI